MKRIIPQTAAWLAAIPIVIASVIFVYTVSVPTPVLEDWTINLPSGPFKIGQVVAVDSHYTKVRDVSGVAHRYIECKTIGSTYTRYPLSEAEANHASGTRTGTGVFVTIPPVAQVPTMCHITISVDYKIYLYKNQTEVTSSKDFLVTN